MTKPVISVVLGSYNRLGLLKLTIETVRRELDDFPHEIIVIDGGSTDGAMNWLSQQNDIVTLIQHNRGMLGGEQIERKSWGYFMNLGFKSAQGKYICMISDDCLIIPGAIKNGHKLYESKLAAGHKVGAMAFYYRNWPDEKNYQVRFTPSGKMYVNHGLYLKIALEEVGFIDEERYQFYYADCDLCMKLLGNGYICIDSPTSFVEHYSHADTDLRHSNIATANSDLNSFLDKWKNLYPMDKVASESVWEKEFHDSTDTIGLFRHTNELRSFFIKSFIKRLIKKRR